MSDLHSIDVIATISNEQSEGVWQVSEGINQMALVLIAEFHGTLGSVLCLIGYLSDLRCQLLYRTRLLCRRLTEILCAC